MAQDQENWEPFDEEEAPSLSDLPVTSDDEKPSSARREEGINDSPVAEEFEFRSWSNNADLDMCAADQVFHQGRILPLRPSVSSDSGLVLLRGRCDSVSSLGFSSGRSNSVSSRSSGGMSRSQSSSSASSAAPRRPVSDGFYARPTPRPKFGSPRNSNANRKSGGFPWPGWAILQLGVSKAPEIELSDLRARQMRLEKKSVRGKLGAKSGKESNGSEKGSKVEKRVPRILGFGCKCSPEAVEDVSSRVLFAKKKEEGVGLKRGASMRQARVFEWLEALSIAKATVA